MVEVKQQSLREETVLAQVGNRSEQATGTVSVPIYLSTAFRHEGIGMSTGFDYTRTGNPTRAVLEDALRVLENGTDAFAFASGMAAINTLLLCFKQGDEWVVSKDLYGGTYRLFETVWRDFGIQFTYDSFIDLDLLEKRITPNTRVFFIETPSNPLMQETDIARVTELARKYNIVVIVDNTFYTPYIQKPLELGADIVVHSATKYLAGHNDVLAGAIVTNHGRYAELIRKHQNGAGAVLSPFDSWLLMRGLKTLALRMERHEQNARLLAEWLSDQPEVTDVLYSGRGGMLSFRVREENWVNPFLQNLNIITFAESLGGVESFITYPATQTHMDIPYEIRVQNGVCNRLLRFSVGIEHVEDLKSDLRAALTAMKG
ncbi:MAG: methionine biosynthesis PLP-dependent protein [Bacilli bacterium]